jgi:wyosine [tRNA(Phe)-imidazoG37] synthetase (radical SAM superfamily)
MTIRLKNKVIYGPVQSRRLGSSLGINIMSPDKKICNLNCVYCQYGWTNIIPNDIKNNNNFIDTEKILIAVEKALIALIPSPNYITFSGNGEATIHPDFDNIVDGVIELRNKYVPNSKTAILSNSTNVANEQIRKTLSNLDVRIMKLDCGDENLFKIYNRPVVLIELDSIIQGLSKMNDVIIQTLFTAGDHGNSKGKNIEHWIEKLKQISPSYVQIYTLDRGYPSNRIYPVEFEWLYELQNILNELEIKSIAYV